MVGTLAAVVSHTEDRKTTDRAHALIQLLKNRSYEEIRQRMYDNPPGSPWWQACQAELEIRNGEQTAAALRETARVLERMRASTEHFERLSETLAGITTEARDVFEGGRQSGRRLEIAIYVAIGMTVAQFFMVVFQAFGKK